MEDFFEIIIYIIIGIVATIIGATKNKNKKRPGNIPVPDPDSGDDYDSDREKKEVYEPFKDLFEPIREETYYEVDEDAVVADDRSQDAEPILDSVTKESPVSKIDTVTDEGVSVFTDSDILKKYEKIGDLDSGFNDQIKDDIKEHSIQQYTLSIDFDIKQAVIYSEILNRKEY